MEKVEAAARIIARAFGHGCAWDTRVTHGEDAWQPTKVDRTPTVRLGAHVEDEPPSAVSDSLPVCRETEALERASDSASGWLGRRDADPSSLSPEQRRARSRTPLALQEAAWEWERANPLCKGQQANPHRPREFEHWNRTRAGAGVQVVRPLHAFPESAMAALTGIAKPMRSALLRSRASISQLAPGQ